MTNDRMTEFKHEVQTMKLGAGSPSRDAVQQVIGLVLMVAGVVVALVTYATSLNQDDVRDVISSGTLVIAMVVLALLGAALFISATVTRFLRFWMLRQLYEGQANAARLSEAVSTALSDSLSETS
jgi:hypothetical protein